MVLLNSPFITPVHLSPHQPLEATSVSKSHDSSKLMKSLPGQLCIKENNFSFSCLSAIHGLCNYSPVPSTKSSCPSFTSFKHVILCSGIILSAIILITFVSFERGAQAPSVLVTPLMATFSLYCLCSVSYRDVSLCALLH